MADPKKKFWILQQGTTYFAVESAGPPDIKVPEGERRKVIKAAYQDKATAEARGRDLAKHWNGTWRD